MRFIAISATIIALLLTGTSYAKKGGSSMVENGKKVSFEYTLTVEGRVVDSSKGKGALEYTHGKGMIIPGLEKKLEGLKVGDERTVVVGAEDAYGPVNPEMFREIPKSAMKGIEPQAGMVVEMHDNNGRAIPAIIMEVKDQTVVVNFNHPLAGKELTFDVKIVDID